MTQPKTEGDDSDPLALIIVGLILLALWKVLAWVVTAADKSK